VTVGHFIKFDVVVRVGTRDDEASTSSGRDGMTMGILARMTNGASGEPPTMKQMVLCLRGKPGESPHPIEPVMTPDKLRERMRQDYLDAIARQGTRMTAGINVNLLDGEQAQRNDDRRANAAPLVTKFRTRLAPTMAR